MAAAPSSVQDTEWDDVLREKGILPPKPKELEVTEEQILAIAEQAVQERLGNKTLEERTLDELDELEDLEDDRVLESYRRQRIAEMRAAANAARHGRLLQITKAEYKVQVTDASASEWVVVHMFQEYMDACKLLNAVLQKLADRYPSVKFVRIVADQCVPNYPDRNVPTVLVYGNGELAAQTIGTAQLGGSRLNERSVTAFLQSVGVPIDAQNDSGNSDSD